MNEVIIVNPVKVEIRDIERDYIKKQYSQDKLKIVNVKNGPETIEGFMTKTIACESILEIVDELKDGSAVVINCFGDPCLFELRELLNIPVFGAGETTMHMAAMLGEFSVIGPGDNMISWTRIQAREYGVFDKLISVEKVHLTVKDILSAAESVYQSTKKAAVKSIKDGADVVVLGCTGFSVMAERLQKEIWEKFRSLVLEPLLTSYSVARSFHIPHGRRGLFGGH
ncbi:MAG: aspartate/glutamate racemase family protein [Thermoplasmata archaeon]|nr:aspartate/glutamate racemase family protein [Thermoplasmata archaeon]